MLFREKQKLSAEKEKLVLENKRLEELVEEKGNSLTAEQENLSREKQAK